jgi:hypothetical protein
VTLDATVDEADIEPATEPVLEPFIEPDVEPAGAEPPAPDFTPRPPDLPPSSSDGSQGRIEPASGRPAALDEDAADTGFAPVEALAPLAEPAKADDTAHGAAPDFATFVEPESAPAADPDTGSDGGPADAHDSDAPAEAALEVTPWPELDLDPDPEPAPPDASAPAPAAAEEAAPSVALPLRASAGGEYGGFGDAMTGAAATPATVVTKSARAKAADARGRRSKLTPTPIDDTPKLRVPETDEPEFVKRSRRKERASRTRRIVMGLGSALLLLALAAQGVLELRNVLAARFPAAQPLLRAACAPFGCRIGLPAQVDNLVIETGELSPLGTGAYSLNTLLRNQGSLVQAWPSIELELVDDNNKALLRRVFGPADYLPAAAIGAGFAARSEQPVRLDFMLAGLKPAGYHLFVFYP